MTIWSQVKAITFSAKAVTWRTTTASDGSPRVAPPGTPVLPAGFGDTAALGRRLFTAYLLPFELTSVLLLVAIVGAVGLAKRRP